MENRVLAPSVDKSNEFIAIENNHMTSRGANLSNCNHHPFQK